MAVRQLLSPNLDNDPKKPLYIWIGGKIITDWYGWCLAVIAGSFGAKGSSYSAKTAWQACNTKHYDFNIPEKVWLPVWWEGGTYGHVAQVYRNGNHITAYSSPYTHKATFEVFESDNIEWLLNYIGQIYRVGNFTGWSETLLDSRIIEFYQEKSNEDICKEVWEGKWGTGRDRKNRLTEAGYDYDTIQGMIDQGIGKPEPEPVAEPEPTPPEPVEAPEPVEPQPEPTPTPEPVPEPSSEPTEPIDTEEPEQIIEPSDNNNEKEDKEPMSLPQEDQQLIADIVEESSSVFNPSDKTKRRVYIIIDIFFYIAVILPFVSAFIDATTIQTRLMVVSNALTTTGAYWALVFKLVKKKK